MDHGMEGARDKIDDIPPYPAEVMRYMLHAAKPILIKYFKEGEEVADINLVTAHLAKCIWKELNSLKKKNKRLRKTKLMKVDAMNMAYRIASMLLLMGELDDAGMSRVQDRDKLAMTTDIIADMSLKAGGRFDSALFIERWNYIELNKK